MQPISSAAKAAKSGEGCLEKKKMATESSRLDLMVRTAEQKLPAIHQCPICDKEDPLIRKQGRRLRSEGGAEQRLLPVCVGGARGALSHQKRAKSALSSELLKITAWRHAVVSHTHTHTRVCATLKVSQTCRRCVSSDAPTEKKVCRNERD